MPPGVPAIYPPPSLQGIGHTSSPSQKSPSPPGMAVSPLPPEFFPPSTHLRERPLIHTDARSGFRVSPQLASCPWLVWDVGVHTSPRWFCLIKCRDSYGL